MVMSTTFPAAYPVHVDAELDPHVSRGLWLIKWLLALPHYVVLAFLWVAFAVMSAFAFFAILFTGRYPRAVFDFNVGVLRWSWRVAYYAYGALGTDRYPPFSLRERADYPAHLEIDYPHHLSRGLVLVKWWLLAIPHYLIVGILLSGGVTLAGDLGDSGQWVGSTGLIGLLVLVAAVVLLFTGRYPQPVFDLVLGLNRWVLRVAAYAGLMTDQYPPFRLDQGGHEPAGRMTFSGPTGIGWPTAITDTTPTGTEQVAPPVGPPGTDRRSGWTGGRVTAAVAGSLLLVVSLGTVAAGVAAAVADNAMRDDAGFLMSDTETFSTETFAIASQPLEVHLDGPGALAPDSILGEAKVTATGDGVVPLFVGVAASEDVDRYLEGVRHATVIDLADAPTYATTGDGPPRLAPTDRGFWAASATGTGTLSVEWPVESGDWTLVVMNADGSDSVAAEVAVGATAPALEWITPVLLSIGLTGTVLAALLLVLTIRSAEVRTRHGS
jgi:hypothetical protein